MRIGVISDTHGGMIDIDYALRKAGAVDAWIHLGDYCADARFLEKGELPVYCVRGNCDVLCEEREWERVFEWEGVRILATHGHLYRVKQDPYRVVLRARELGCAVALYGHTHAPMLSNEGDVLLVNPGSASRPALGYDSSIAILTVADGKADASIITV